MLSMFGDTFSKKNTKSDETEVSVRSPEQIEQLENLVVTGPITFILVHADWCGPCQRYKPQWKELFDIPGRTANMAMIHHDMVENSPMLKNAKIPGYPSVLKVFPNGHIETYKDESNKPTNAVPNIRDSVNMKKELLEIPVIDLNRKKNNLAKNMTTVNKPNRNSFNLLNNIKTIPVSRFTKRNISNSLPKVKEPKEVIIGATNPMKGGSLYLALSSALKASAPVGALLFANEVLRKKRNNTNLPPKKNRGSTKRLTRKARKTKH